VYLLRLPDHKPILDQLPDVLPAVRHGDFIDLIRVQPHLPFPTLEDTGCQPLLQLEGHHGVLPSVARPPSVFLLPSRPLVRSVRSAASSKAKRKKRRRADDYTNHYPNGAPPNPKIWIAAPVILTVASVLFCNARNG